MSMKAISDKIETRKAQETEELNKLCFELANGFAHEHELFVGSDEKTRRHKIQFFATWVRECCDRAVDVAGSYAEGLAKGRELQFDEDNELLKQMKLLQEKLGVEGDQSLLEALEWKLEDENRILREEVRDLGKKARKEGFELGVREMRLRVENRTEGFIKAVLNAQAEELVSRGPNAK